MIKILIYNRAASLTLTVLATGVLSCGDQAVNGQEPNQSIVTRHQSEVIYSETKDFPNNTQLAIALIEHGVTRFYGVERHNDTIITIQNQYGVFEIGSISKVFTSTLLAGFALSEKLTLDDPVNDFLDFSFKDNISFTFTELANHTSGLPRLPVNLILSNVDLGNPYKDYGREELVEYLTQQLELESEDHRVNYSNLGVGLLGFTLSEIANTSYEDLLQSMIFDKYHMPHSTTNRALINELLVTGLDKNGRETPNWDLNVLVAAGGILSSVEDLSKFAKAHFDTLNNELNLTREITYSDYHKGTKLQVGLGWMIKNKQDQRWYWHNGATGGYSSNMLIDVKNKNGVIILSNVSGFSGKRANIDNLGDRLMASLNTN